MKKIAMLPVFSALITACILMQAAQAQPVQTWPRFLDVTVNTASGSGGANVSGPVANFPLLVRLDSANAAALFAEAQPGGADIRFASEAGVEIPHQIVTWSATRANIWVRVPAIAGNAATKVRLYWGKAGASTTSNSAAVFDTLQYTGVWQMNEGTGDSTVAIGAGTTADATGNHLNFTRHSNTRSAPGVTGFSRYYNPGQAAGANDAGSMTTYIVDSIDNNTKFQARSGEPITISAWTSRTGGSNGSSGIFGHFRYTAGAYRSYCLLRTGTAFRTIVSTGGTGDDIAINSSANFGATTNLSWLHVTLAISPTSGIKMYVNGVQEINDVNPAQPLVANTDAAARPLIGALERNFGQRFVGLIDELRLSNGVLRNADWAKLDYETQKPTATAVTVGAAQNNDTTRIFFYPLKTASYPQSTPITANTPYVKAGNTASAFSINPALPAGLSFSTVTGAITGTPTTVAAAASYVVTATIDGNPYLDTLSISVFAGSPPGAPQNVAAVAGASQATVSWAAPAFSGTTAITGYTVRAVEDTAKTCAWTTGTLSCVVSGLSNGTSYTFTVRAANSFGFGPASAASAAVIPSGPPGAPTNVTAVQGASGAASAVISWSAPTNNGGQPVSDYYVTAAPGGLQCYSPPVTNPSCTVTGLTYGTPYTFTVVAANPAGNGPTSAPSNMVTPVGILPQYAIRVDGSSRPFVFALTSEAMRLTDALTMTISDVHGRVLWSRTVKPKADGVRELRWNGTTSTGHAVSPGVYMVRASTVAGGTTATLVRPAVRQ